MMSLQIVCCHVPASALIPTYSNQFSKSALALNGVLGACRANALERHATSNADMEPFVAGHYMVFNQHSLHFADKFASSTFDFRMVL